ncbi:MAG: hypothetical protein GXO90_02225, partial [FCB group bacterium]|nr:hypothetical protein [FCB group bacterium]
YHNDADYRGTVAEPVKFEEYLKDLGKRIPVLVPDKEVKISILEWNSNDNWKDANKFKQGLYTAGFLNTLERQSHIVEHALVWPALRRVQLPYNHASDQALIWYDNHRIYLSPTALALKLYRQNYAPVLVHSEVECDTFDSERISRVPYLDVVATRDEDSQTLILKVVNKSEESDISARITIDGLPSPISGGKVKVFTLTGPNVYARNDLDQPDVIRIMESTLEIDGPDFQYVFPAHSASILRIGIR